MEKVHFVQMWLGQICVGMIHKFVPSEVKDSIFKKRESGGFLKQLTELQEIPQITEKIDEAVAKARELKRMFAQKEK